MGMTASAMNRKGGEYKWKTARTEEAKTQAATIIQPDEPSFI